MIVRNYLSRSTTLNGRYFGSTEAMLQLHFFGIHIYIYIYIYLVKFQLLLRLSWRATSTQSLLASQPSAYVSPLRTVFRKIESGTVYEHSFLKP